MGNTRYYVFYVRGDQVQEVVLRLLNCTDRFQLIELHEGWEVTIPAYAGSQETWKEVAIKRHVATVAKRDVRSFS